MESFRPLAIIKSLCQLILVIVHHLSLSLFHPLLVNSKNSSVSSRKSLASVIIPFTQTLTPLRGRAFGLVYLLLNQRRTANV